MDRTNPRSLPSAGLPATASSAALDAHGYHPDDYDWVPVRRKPRSDGWSHERQRGFIEALADCGSVMDAARQIGMSASSAYRLRRSPGGEAFAAAWDAAIHQAALHLVDVAFDRAIKGLPIPTRQTRRWRDLRELWRRSARLVLSIQPVGRVQHADGQFGLVLVDQHADLDLRRGDRLDVDAAFA